MAKNPTQNFKVPTTPKVRHRKRVPKSMGRKANAGNVQLLPEYTEIPFKVPNGDLCIVLCAKDVFTSGSRLAPPEKLTKLITKGYKAVFVSFPNHVDNEIVVIYRFFLQSKNLTRPKPTIKNRKRNQMRPRKIPPRNLPLYDPIDIGLRKRG
jgi:hypothetical protein